jgi:hypothetical protein
MAKPNSTSCISGTPSIIAKVIRSRRIWIASLVMIAISRRNENNLFMPCCPSICP